MTSGCFSYWDITYIEEVRQSLDESNYTFNVFGLEFVEVDLSR